MTRKSTALARTVCGLALLLAAGCSSDTAQSDAQSSLMRQALSELKSPLTRKRAATTAPKAPDLETIIREAMTLNKGPLILIAQDGQPPTVLGQIGENRANRTYATPDMQSITLRNGVVAATRGMGDDLISAEVDAVIAVLSSRASAANVPRTMRFLDGLGTERPLPMTCAISPTKTGKSPVPGGTTLSGTLMTEQCTGQGFSLSNSYLVAKDRTVVASRQWISQRVGYLTLQTLRR